MGNDAKLSAVLGEFARTLTTDFPIQAILDRLVERIVDMLPVTGAGVTLIRPGMAPHYVAASDDSALRFERLQTEIAQGPCLLAYNSGVAVAAADLPADTRFPLFGPAAVGAGLAAVFAFPLRHGDTQLGALDLYRDTPGPLGAADMEAAQTLADVATAYLLNAQAREDAQTVSERFRYNALHDSLTGLPNRALLQQRIDHAAARAQRSHTHAAVLFADLDRFKEVNDTHGHQAGDRLLRAVAQRLSTLVRSGDTLARVSGDEFVFLCEDLNTAGEAEVLADRIGRAFRTPFVLEGEDAVQLQITASVGLAYAGPGEAVSNHLVVDADIAMYQAKRKGGATHQGIDLREARRSDERHRFERDLGAALRRGELDVAYQPIVDLRDGTLTGVEALLRWTHPDRGAVPACHAVDAAERTGLITGIGAWVLGRGCADQSRWLLEHPGLALDMAVNVSVHQLMAPGFTDTVTAALEDSGMDPAALILEMTEGIFIENAARAVAVLADIKALGVRLALDDFGTGYSSLSYLRQFPIDIVKIDQGFVADIGRQPTGAAIIDAVTNLAHVLGLHVTAEGVETPAQRDEVAAIGCDSAQGYLYARPLRHHELDARLAASRGRPLRFA